MRLAFVQALMEAARQDPKVQLVTSDLGFLVFEDFMQQFPDQFTNAGVAEANSLGMASGMAQSGLTPICYSIIPFFTFRAFEQIRNDIAYPKANVKIVGIGSGLSYGYNGISHHALEDLAVMRALPNMTILAPADPLETYQATMQMMAIDGPVYLRLGKVGEPILSYAQSGQFAIGKPQVMRTGKDVLLLSTGTMLKTALDVATQLGSRGIEASVVHVGTVKPLDAQTITPLLAVHPKVVTIEEHTTLGGFGSAVAEINVSQASPKPQLLVGTGDRFYNLGGSQAYLKKQAGLDAPSITDKILQWL